MNVFEGRAKDIGDIKRNDEHEIVSNMERKER